jgi:NAD(P)-dependent dehydrogenase (short-subunit alcohol dehydrogenase family)
MPAETTSEDPVRHPSADAAASDRPAEAGPGEHRALAQQVAVSSAESVVARARGRSLLIAQDAAARQLSAARAALWAADQSGDPDSRDRALAAVAAAHARLDGLVAQLLRAWTTPDGAAPPPDLHD